MGENNKGPKTSLRWLDNPENKSEDDSAVQEQLTAINSDFQKCATKEECIQYVQSQSEDTRITLIVSGRLGAEIVPQIHSLTQIAAIYVYCSNRAMHEEWAKKFDKVKGVFTDFTLLKNALQPNQTGGAETSATEASTTTDTSTTPCIQIPSTYELNSLFRISDSCLEYIYRMKLPPEDKDDFISFCQEALKDDESLIALIREFQESYTANQAILWLNKHAFFSGLLENIFKVGYIEIMYYCRVLLHDIQKQLDQHKCTSTSELYRSELMSDEQFQDLKKFNGKTIAMKSFLLTSLNRDKALAFTSESSTNNEFKRILFIINADPKIEDIKPFAKIGSIGNNNDQDDVLFMIGSLFKITEIQDEKDGIINVKMTVCEDDDTSDTKRMFDGIKYQFMSEQGETDIIGFGQFLYTLGSSIGDTSLCDNGEKFINSYLKKLSNDHSDRSRCYNALGYFELIKNNLDACLDWYKKSFDMKKTKYNANDINLAENYQDLALVYLKKQDFKQALDYFEKLLTTWKNTYGDNDIHLSFCYTNMAAIHEVEKNLMKAMACYYQALAIMTEHEPENKVGFAAIYTNLGNLYIRLQYYHLALGYHTQSLELKTQIYTTVHPSVAGTYKNIALVYEDLNNIQQSRENFEKAAAIYRQLYSPDDGTVKEIEELIRNLPNINSN